MLRLKFYQDNMLKKRLYFWLFATSIVLFVSSFFPNGESILDINVHDTYYVIEHRHLYFFLAIILLFFFIVYWLLEKVKVKLIGILSKLHIYGTLISIIGMLFPYGLIFKSTDSPLHDDMQYVNISISICGLLFLLFQFLFIINIFVSIIKKLCNSVTQT